jgi:hypothetical protein
MQTLKLTPITERGRFGLLRRQVSARLRAAALALTCTAASLTAAVSPSASAAQGFGPAAPQEVPTINWALSGTASAQTSQPDNPASNAIDGDAATSWCTASWPDTLTVDLGQVRQLDGLGGLLHGGEQRLGGQTAEELTVSEPSGDGFGRDR